MDPLSFSDKLKEKILKDQWLFIGRTSWYILAVLLDFDHFQKVEASGGNSY